jgi:hypothetical protein
MLNLGADCNTIFKGTNWIETDVVAKLGREFDFHQNLVLRRQHLEDVPELMLGGPVNRICTSGRFFYLFISGSTASPLCSRIRLNWSYALGFLRPRLNETKYPYLSASVSYRLD